MIGDVGVRRVDAHRFEQKLLKGPAFFHQSKEDVAGALLVTQQDALFELRIHVHQPSISRRRGRGKPC